MKAFFCFFFSFGLIGCSDLSDSPQLLRSVNGIYEKNIAFKKNEIAVVESRVEVVDGVEYIIEEKIVFDDEGVSYLMTGGSEGFIVHSKRNERAFLPIENPSQYRKITIDRSDNSIVDGGGKIRKFKISIKGKLILTDELEGGRVYIYKFN